MQEAQSPWVLVILCSPNYCCSVSQASQPLQEEVIYKQAIHQEKDVYFEDGWRHTPFEEHIDEFNKVVDTLETIDVNIDRKDKAQIITRKMIFSDTYLVMLY